MASKRHRTIFLVSLCSLVAILILVFLFLSPITKYLIEKYDRQLCGRELTLEYAYVNPFSGFVRLKGLTMYELQGDSVFISTKSVHASISMLKLFSRVVEIRDLTVDGPRARFIQNKRVFNFDDIIQKLFMHPGHSKWRVNLTDEKIKNGEFHFIDKVIPINYFIKETNITFPGKLNQGDTVAAQFTLKAGIGTGNMKGDFTIDSKTKGYRLAVRVHDLDLEIIRQYIWELINYGMFTAHLDADLHARGNFNSKDSISLRGRMEVRDFHLGKTTTDDYFAFKNMVMVVQELSPFKKKYLIDTLLLTAPFLKYERYDSLDNLQTLFGKRGKNITDITRQEGRFNLVIEIARYMKVITRNFFRSDYKIDRLRLVEGKVQFNDYSLSEKFGFTISPLTIEGDSVNENKRLKLSADARFQPFGLGNAQFSINPKDSGDFDIHYHFQKVPASTFNPYLITYTSFPVNRGTFEVRGDWKVRDGIINSTNHLVMVDPRLSKRIFNKNMKWLPMPLLMAFARERGNVMDYEIPITGSLKNPNFHLHDVILDVLKNIFVKPVTTPYRLEMRDVEEEIEKSLTVQWEMRQHTLRPSQVRFVKHIARFFKSDSSATITVHPFTFTDREKEYILFFETKKKYYLTIHHKDAASFTPTDSMEVEQMSIKDPKLVEQLSKNVSDTVMFNLQEKSYHYIGDKIVNDQFHRLINERERMFLSYFKENGTEKQVTILTNTSDIPYNGFSYFKLKYEKNMPASLQLAYHRMIEINNEESRSRYKSIRESASKISKQGFVRRDSLLLKKE